MRGRAVNWSRRLRMIESQEQDADHIVDVNPAEPMFAGSDWSTQSQPKRSEHLRQSAALFVEHNPDPNTGDSNLSRLGRNGRLFPSERHLRQSITAREFFFDQLFIAAGAVIANG